MKKLIAAALITTASWSYSSDGESKKKSFNSLKKVMQKVCEDKMKNPDISDEDRDYCTKIIGSESESKADAARKEEPESESTIDEEL
jgi:hypothetical protein